MNIYVIGHISPDLDTVASAVGYAEFLKKTKRYDGSSITPLVAGSVNKETNFVFSKFGVDIPKDIESFNINQNDAFVLVDHNEESQRHSKVASDQVIEIIDHHKINISFTSPIRLDVKPLGSTSTLVYEHFDMYGIGPSEAVLGLILSSILSDTQGLKASTTTGYDSEVAHRISKKLNLDIDEYIFDLFKAKSDISGLSAEEISTKDYKIFKFGEIEVLINQIETVEPEKVIHQKEKLVEKMNELKSKFGVSQYYTIVTDILKVNSQAIYTNAEEKRILEQAFTSVGNDNIIDIGPMLSRKKDIAPKIEKAIIH